MSWWQRLRRQRNVRIVPAPSAAVPTRPRAVEPTQEATSTVPAEQDQPSEQFLTVASEIRDALSALDRNDQRLDERLAGLGGALQALDRLDPLDARLASIADWVERTDDQLAAVAEQIKKLNRTYFKANALAEAQTSRMESALATLDSSVDLHREQFAHWQQEAGDRARAARLQVVEAVLPVLDGVEQALGSGQSYLQRQSAAVPFRPSLGDRLAYALGHKLPPPAPDVVPVKAWLSGLDLIRERLLAVLAGEGVRPMQVLGQPFDPYRHLAVALADPARFPDAAPGTVVEEQRRGYVAGEHVLRYAEVVVLPADIDQTSPEMAFPPPEQPRGAPAMPAGVGQTGDDSRAGTGPATAGTPRGENIAGSAAAFGPAQANPIAQIVEAQAEMTVPESAGAGRQDGELAAGEDVSGERVDGDAAAISLESGLNGAAKRKVTRMQTTDHGDSRFR